MAYAAGMAMGLFFLSNALSPATPLPHAQQAVIWGLFPIGPLHVAIGYDFYLRFPGGIASGRIWRALRLVLYGLCGTLALVTFAEFIALAAGEPAYLDLLVRLAPSR